MRPIIVILTIFASIAVGGFFGFIGTAVLSMSACDSAGFVSEDICAAGWLAPIFALPLIGGLVGGGILDYRWGHKIAGQVIGRRL